MSIDNHSTAAGHAPLQIRMAQSLPEAEQTMMTSLLSLLPASTIQDIHANEPIVDGADVVTIKNMVDGRGLACPMPLLKTKVALRTVAVGESLYVVATDPNSQTDITAFCLQSKHINDVNPLLLIVNQTTIQSSVNTSMAQASDTMFHFIITKTDSN